MRSLCSWLAGVVVLAGVMIGPRSALADGFGLVKKPVIPVSFFSHQAGWIEFWYPPSARERVNPLIAQADDVRAELGKVLGSPPLDGVEVRIARGSDEMATFAPPFPPGSPHPMAARSVAITYPALKLVVLSLGDLGAVQQGELGEAFRGELGRVALYQATRGRTIPSWLYEGFSADFAGERAWSRWWLVFTASVLQGIAPLDALDDLMARGGSDGALAIAEGADFVGFLLRPEMRPRFAACADQIGKGEMFASAVAGAYGKTLPELEKVWRTDLRERCVVRGAAFLAAVPTAVLVGIVALRSIKRRKVRREADKKTAESAAAASERQRVHIVFSRREESAEPPIVVEPEVPRVEHEGEWHTLH
jgi:hypothetical protein